MRLTRRKARISKQWVGCPPSPHPCLLLILRNNRGCSHLPKTPSSENEGGKAASWLNKAETPVFQKHTDVDRHTRLQTHLPSRPAVWGGEQLGWETHTIGKASLAPPYPHSLAILLLPFLPLSLALVSFSKAQKAVIFQVVSSLILPF